MARQTTIDHLRLPHRYAAALAEALAFIHERYQPIGIVASGTIIRGAPDPASDFDIVVAHEAPWRQRCQRLFRDVPVEMFVNPPFQIRRAFRNEASAARPVLAHMIATGAILHDSDEVMATLREEARIILRARPEVSDDERTNARYLIATAFEDAEDIRHRDPERAEAIVITTALDAIRLHFRQSGRWHPREKDLFVELEELDPELGSLARRMMRATTLDARFDAGREIVRRITGATGFFAWESAPQALAPDDA